MSQLYPLSDLYRFPGFTPRPQVEDDSDGPGVVVTLDRRAYPQKWSATPAANRPGKFTTIDHDAFATCRVAIDPSSCPSRFDESFATRVTL
jgi:hypothetical protein